MARRVDGRMVSPELDDLGAAVVGSYLGSRGPGTSYREHFGDWSAAGGASGSELTRDQSAGGLEHPQQLGAHVLDDGLERLGRADHDGEVDDLARRRPT